MTGWGKVGAWVVLGCATVVVGTGCGSSRSGTGDAGAIDGAVDGGGMDASVDGAASCASGETSCGGVCTAVAADDRNCGRCGNVCSARVGCVGGTCSCHAPMLACGGVCLDPRSDITNCGTCGNACAATDQCTAGVCIPMCTAPRMICFEPPGGGGMDGGVADGGLDAGPATMPVCVDLQTDPDHCGTCTTRCRGGGVCAAGRCMCPMGLSACSGTCVDLTTSVDFCGDCITSCGAGGTCAGGDCTTCGPGRTPCPGGSCPDTMTDRSNCGMCGRRCGAGETCVDGMCSCGAPRADCGAGCIDITTDPDNCGRCGNSCGAGGACAAGACTCAAGFMMCGTACANLMTDRNHCGACDRACPAMQVCIMGTCSTAPLYHGWTSPIAGCSTASYDTTAPTVLGGTYPFNMGDSNACRAWKLAATVCTTMPTMYTDTNNWTCPASGGFTDPVFGTYCRPTGTGAQYACSTCPGSCNAMCVYNPLSLRNCMGVETAQM